jgi:hypothetical protein
MQISRILPLACAAAVLLSCFAVRADDNEAQMRARQALEQKMKDLPPPAEETPATSAKKKKAKKESTATTAPIYSAPATAPVVETAPPTAPKVVEPTPPAAPVISAPVTPAPTNPAVTATPKPAQPPIEEYHPAKPAPQNPPAGFPPLEAPASSLPASKEQRLQQLLQLYKADQITPQEYHDQRAKILSEP